MSAKKDGAIFRTTRPVRNKKGSIIGFEVELKINEPPLKPARQPAKNKISKRRKTSS
jgi:hypothetical protein